MIKILVLAVLGSIVGFCLNKKGVGYIALILCYLILTGDFET
jgi:hypothetical protein